MMYKKLIFMLMFLCLVLTNAHAKSKYESVYSLFPYCKIIKVEHSDTATIVTFRIKAQPESQWIVPTCCYLQDSKLNHYPLLASSVNETDRCIRLNKTGKMTFSLAFKPMPKDEECFDLLSDSRGGMSFNFYGIHKRKMEIPVMEEAPVAKAEFMTDSPCMTYVKGHICDYKRSGLPDLLKVYGLRAKKPTALQTLNSQIARIDENGDFTLEFLIDMPLWVSMHLDNRTKVPLFVCPGDTLYVNMANLNGAAQVVDYRSAKGFPTYASLLKADTQQFNYWDSQYLAEGTSYAEKKNRINSSYEQAMRLDDYLSQRYHLSPKETRILKNRDRLCLAHTALVAINTEESVCKDSFALDDAEYQWAMKNVDILDATLFYSEHAQYLQYQMSNNRYSEIGMYANHAKPGVSTAFWTSMDRNYKDKKMNRGKYDIVGMDKPTEIANQLIAPYKGKYTSVVFLDSLPKSRDFLDKALNVIEDFREHNDIKLLYVVCKEWYDQYELEELSRFRHMQDGMCLLTLKEYRQLQTDYSLSPCQCISFTRDGKLLRNSLDINDDYTFRIQVRRLLKSER